MLQTVKRSRISKAIKITLATVAAYISIIGLVTFSLFIMEESLQTIMFGTWAAQEAKDWKLVLEGCDKMRQIKSLITTTNRAMGWVQPLSYLAYRSYAESTDYYTRSLEMKVFSYSPESFEGREVQFHFIPKRAVKTSNDQYMLLAGRTFIRSDKPDLKPRVVKGYLFASEKGKWEIRRDKDSIDPNPKIKFSMKKRTKNNAEHREHAAGPDFTED
jgi:hypothetical protein